MLIILYYKNIVRGGNPVLFIKTEYSMKITGDQNQQISFVNCRSENLPAAFYHASVFKCLDCFVSNLGRLSIVRGVLGFAFHFLNNFSFLLSCSSWFGEETQPMILPCLPYTLPTENFKFWSLFFNCLNLRVLKAIGYLLFREVSPNWSHTDKKESIAFQIQTVSKRLFYITRGFCFASWFLFPWRKLIMTEKQTVLVFSFKLKLLQCFLH